MKPTFSLMRLVVVFSILFHVITTNPGHADILFAPDGSENTDVFGVPVSVSGNTVVIGATGKDNYFGGAYIYRYDGNSWNETTLNAPDGGQQYDYFGQSVSVSGDTAIVGTGNNRNTAYIYQYDGGNWNQTILSVPDDGQQYDFFGYSVSVSGDTAVVGAYGKNNQQGNAYIYQYDGSNWNQTILSASDGQEWDQFGYSVSVSGDTAIVGANGKNNYQGGVYIYQYDGTNWNPTILSASDGKEWDQFGYSVSVSGDNAIVGANGKNSNQGGAYIYQYDGSNWNPTILSASDGQESDEFGVSVSMSGDNAIVGASGKNNYQGGAYIYQYDGSNWNEIILTGSNGQDWDGFGNSVSLDPDGDRFAIGGYAEKVYTNTVGALTTFNKGSQIEMVEGINFTSPMNWVIGADTSGNMLILADGTADISATGKAVYVGQSAGANGNILVLNPGGALIANAVHIGSVDGNTGNMLALDSGADWSQLASIYLTEGNMLAFGEEFWASPEQVFSQLGDTKLYASYADGDVLITLDNYMDYLEIGDLADLSVSAEYGDGYGTGTYVMAKAMVIPEPATGALWLSTLGLFAFRRRKN